jgi:hypothetical protein
MESKRGQGISLNFIVVAIIAALVLVIIIAFTIGGLGTSLSKIFQAGEQNEDSDVDLAKANCESACDTASVIDSPADWNNADYCTRIALFDGEQVNCWEAPINIKCSAEGDDVYDSVWECDESVCRTCDEIGCTGIVSDNDDTCKDFKYNSCLSEMGAKVDADGEIMTDEAGNEIKIKLCEWKQ